jgi:hypothetical protein
MESTMNVLNTQNTNTRAQIRAAIDSFRRELNLHETENFPSSVQKNVGSFLGIQNPSISIVVDGDTAPPASFGASFVDSTSEDNTSVSLA